MAVFGYIFRLEDEEPGPAQDEPVALNRYAAQLGLKIEHLVVDAAATLPAAEPFHRREGGGKLWAGCRHPDAIVTTQARWVLGAVAESARLLQALRGNGVSLYCADIGGDISCDEKRRLVVSTGCAGLVQKLLAALTDGIDPAVPARPDASRPPTGHSGVTRGKYLGGPVPFGRKVNRDGFLEEDPEQQELIAAIAAMRADRRSYREISRRLEEQFQVRLSYEGVRRILLARNSPPER